MEQRRRIGNRTGRTLATLVVACAALASAATPAMAATPEREQGLNQAPRQFHAYPMMPRSFWGMHRGPWMHNRVAPTDGTGHMDNWSTAAWILMAAGMIAFWAVAVIGVVLLLQRRDGPKAQGA